MANEEIRGYNIGFHYVNDLNGLNKIKKTLNDFHDMQLRREEDKAKREAQLANKSVENTKKAIAARSKAWQEANKYTDNERRRAATQALVTGERVEEILARNHRKRIDTEIKDERKLNKAAGTLSAERMAEEEKAYRRTQNAKIKNAATDLVNQPTADGIKLAKQLAEEEKEAAKNAALVDARLAEVEKARMQREKDLAEIRAHHAKEQADRQKAIQNNRVKQAVSGITAGPDEEGIRLAQQLAEEERAAAKAADRLAKAEARRLSSLEKAKAAILSSTYMNRENVSDAQKEAQARIKSRVEAAKTAAEVRKIAGEEKALAADSDAYTRQLRRQGYLIERMSTSAKQLAGSFISAFAVYEGGKSIFNAAKDMQSFRVAIDSVSGSMEQGASNFKYISDLADKLGLDLRGAAKGFSQILAAGQGKYSMEQMRDIFKSVTDAATVMHLSQEDVNGTILAISQMMSKGKVQAQELRLQLGNRLSPAFRLFAKAANVSTQQLDKMMQQGKVFTAKYLPQFAKQLEMFAKPGMQNALKSWVVAFGRFKKALVDVSNQMVNNTELGNSMGDMFNELHDFLEDNMPLWKSFGRILSGFFKLATSALKALDKALKGIGESLDTSTKALGKWSGLLLLTALPAVFRTASGIGKLAASLLGLKAAEEGAFDVGLLGAFFKVAKAGIAMMMKRLLPLVVTIGLVEEGINYFTHKKNGLFWSKPVSKEQAKKNWWFGGDSLDKISDANFKKQQSYGIGDFFNDTRSYMQKQPELSWTSVGNWIGDKLSGMTGSPQNPQVNVTVHTYIDSDEVSSKVASSSQVKDTVDQRMNHHLGN